MKSRLMLALLILTLLMAACARPTTGPGGTPTTPGELPPPQISTTSVPPVLPAVQAYLDAWAAEDYASMYASVSSLTSDALAFETFEARHKDTALSMTLIDLETEIASAIVLSPTTAQAAYRVTYHTALVGDLSRDLMMNLTLESGAWRVAWEEGLILPELRGGNRLAMDVRVPVRGNIYDRNGEPLVIETGAVALGIVPGQIDPEREGRLVSELADLCGYTRQYIESLYEYAAPDWYIPVCEASSTDVGDRYNILSGLSGLVMNEYTTRYYEDLGVGPHVTGYVQLIPVEQLEEYQRQGYLGDERVGMTGLEYWAEDQLAGQRAATLYVVDAAGARVSRLAQVEAVASQNIYTTLDKDLQIQAQKAISGFKGAIVVMEVDTGRILALVSSPTFDPNLFDPQNYNSGWLLGDVFNAEYVPLLNRAAQSPYPLGSVFKIVTMAAAMETGLFTPEDSYYCGHEYTELAGTTLYDWTYEKDYPPSGDLTLPEGLMRSCNPWFYHIGYVLYDMGRPNAISDMAIGFGLNAPTGIGTLEENPGNIDYPASQAEAVQLAIGQGTMLVTPLQVVDFIAAIGNGGTLYRPQVVEKITTPDGVPTYEFAPAVSGELPVSDETLSVIQQAMRSVVANRRGTAYQVFSGLNIEVFGKTGTAQNPGAKPHAWFAGYSDIDREDRPDIAVVVIAENAGEGSEIAAPIFRRIMEVYFNGQPSKLYPWETTYNVTRTPEPLYTNTPEPTETPEPTQTPQP